MGYCIWYPYLSRLRTYLFCLPLLILKDWIKLRSALKTSFNTGSPLKNMGPTREEYRSAREEYGYTPVGVWVYPWGIWVLLLKNMGLPVRNMGIPMKNIVKTKAPSPKNSIFIFYSTPKEILSRGGEWVRVLDAIAPCGWGGGGNTTWQRLTKQCLVHAWLGGPQSWTK